MSTLDVFSKNVSSVIHEFSRSAMAWAVSHQWRYVGRWCEALSITDSDEFIRAIERLQSGMVFSIVDDEFLCPAIRHDVPSIQFLTLTNLYLLLLRLKESTIIPSLLVEKMLDDELLSLEGSTQAFKSLLEADLHPACMNYVTIAKQYQQRFMILKEQFQSLFELFITNINARKEQYLHILTDIQLMLHRLDGLVDNQPGILRRIFNMLDEWHALLPPIGLLIGIAPGYVASADFTKLIDMHDKAMTNAAHLEMDAINKRIQAVDDNMHIITTQLRINEQNTSVVASQRAWPLPLMYMNRLSVTGTSFFGSASRPPLLMPNPDHVSMNQP